MTKKRHRNRSSPGDKTLQTLSKRREPRERTFLETMAEAINNMGTQDGSNAQSGQPNGQYMQYQASPTFAMQQNMPQNMNFNTAPIPFWSPSIAQNTPPTCTSTSPKNINNVNSDLLTVIVNKLDTMDKKLTQLDSTRSSVTALMARVVNIDQKITDVESKVRDIESSREFDSKTLSDMSKRHEELESLVKKMKKYEQEQKQNENSLKEEIRDLKCRSMRDNLLFHKVPEERDENCEQKVLKLIEEKLKIPNASNIKIQRAHRLGAYRAAKTRPIVAKFAFYPDRERIREAARQVKDGTLGVSEQFPRDVMEQRRKLVPIMLKACEEGKEAYIKVDKLFINKQMYKDSE